MKYLNINEEYIPVKTLRDAFNIIWREFINDVNSTSMFDVLSNITTSGFSLEEVTELYGECMKLSDGDILVRFWEVPSDEVLKDGQIYNLENKYIGEEENRYNLINSNAPITANIIHSAETLCSICSKYLNGFLDRNDISFDIDIFKDYDPDIGEYHFDYSFEFNENINFTEEEYKKLNNLNYTDDKLLSSILYNILGEPNILNIEPFIDENNQKLFTITIPISYI